MVDREQSLCYNTHIPKQTESEMSTPLYMELGEACSIVQDYADMHTDGDILAGLREMEEFYDDLDKEERVAYRMFMSAGNKMFAPVDD